MKLIKQRSFPAKIEELTFSPDGQFLFFGQDKEVTVLSTPELEVVTRIPSIWNFAAFSVFHHPSQPWIGICGSNDNYDVVEEPIEVPILNWQKGEVISKISLSGYAPAVIVGAFVNDDLVVTWGGDGSESVVCSLTGDYRREWPIGGESAHALDVHPNGRTILFASDFSDNIGLYFFDALQDTKLPGQRGERETFWRIQRSRIGLYTNFISGAKFSHDGRFVAIAFSDLLVYSFPERKLVFGLDSDGHFIDEPSAKPISKWWSNPVFSSDGRSMYCVSPRAELYEWNLETFGSTRKSERPEIEENGPFKLAIHPANRYLAVASADSDLKLWEL